MDKTRHNGACHCGVVRMRGAVAVSAKHGDIEIV